MNQKQQKNSTKVSPVLQSYANIQRLADRYISKVGATELESLLENAIKTSSLHQKIADSQIKNFIVNEVTEINIKKKLKNYVMFFLIKKYTKYSYADIRFFFRLKSIGPIQFGRTQILNIMQQPKINTNVFGIVTTIEAKIEKLIKDGQI